MMQLISTHGDDWRFLTYLDQTILGKGVLRNVCGYMFELLTSRNTLGIKIDITEDIEYYRILKIDINDFIIKMFRLQNFLVSSLMGSWTGQSMLNTSKSNKKKNPKQLLVFGKQVMFWKRVSVLFTVLFFFHCSEIWGNTIQTFL